MSKLHWNSKSGCFHCLFPVRLQLLQSILICFNYRFSFNDTRFDCEQEWTSQDRQSVCFIYAVRVNAAVLALIDTSKRIAPLSASIGYAACVRKAISASFCTNTICQKCPSATSTQDSKPVRTRSVRFCTSTPNRRSKTVRGMIAVFADTGLPVDIDTPAESYA